jgi:hypothetical protein
MRWPVFGSIQSFGRGARWRGGRLLLLREGRGRQGGRGQAQDGSANDHVIAPKKWAWGGERTATRPEEEA